MKIHSTAVVHPGAELGEGVEVGPYCTIGEHVRVGPGTRLLSHVVLEGWTTLGQENVVHPFAVIGCDPQDLRYRGERAYVVVGDRNQIREHVSIHRASDPEGVTSIGDDNLLMGCVHVAHNCALGNGNVVANYVGLAGHVTVEDQAVLGGMCGIHQFVRIGRQSMVGGKAKVIKDIPPYALVDGIPARIFGPNLRGLRRRGVSQEVRLALGRAFRLITDSGLNLSQAVEAIRASLPASPEREHLLRFLGAASRMGVLNRRGSREGQEPGRGRTGSSSNGRTRDHEEAGL